MIEISKPSSMRQALLKWYDAHQRDLPWRSARPDPYHVMLSEFMLQQTTVSAVKPYYEKFLKQWPSIEDLASANDDHVMAAWAGLGYYSRARNLLKAARAIVHLGAFPQDLSELRKLAGVGEYTAAAIAAIAFDQEVVPIDGNVKRVLARFHALENPIDRPSDEMRQAAEAWAGSRSGALAQAFMDLGSQICRPKNPDCPHCPLSSQCMALAQNRAQELPHRLEKRPKKIWHGHVYVIETPSGIAFEKRDATGLLADMFGLPSNFGESAEFAPPMEAEWQSAGKINHVFTHIDLTLEIWHTRLENAPRKNVWTYLDETQQAGTASLWCKVLKAVPKLQHEQIYD